VVLRLEAGDDEVVAARFQVELLEPVAARRGQVGGAVGEEAAADVVLGGVVVGDPLRVGDQGVGQADRRRLHLPVVPLPERAPLGPPPLEPVDVRGDRDPGGAQHGEQGRVGGVEHDRGVHPVRDEVGHGERGVAQRLKGTTAHRGEDDALHAQILGRVEGFWFGGPAAVDADLVAARGEARPDLLDGRLETPVPRGHTSGSDHRDA
jgi:hypothetical protein